MQVKLCTSHFDDLILPSRACHPHLTSKPLYDLPEPQSPISQEFQTHPNGPESLRELKSHPNVSLLC
jgi:hypothetical protein